MLYFISDASKPIEYVSCGNLTSKDGFVHPRRNIDTFVLIIVIKGALHICQNMVNFDVKENEFILLFPDTLHYGYRPSTGELSYYWVHFYVRDPNYSIYTRGSLLRNRTIFTENADFTPPQRISCCLNTASYPWKGVPGYSLYNYSISTNGKTMWQAGDVTMPSTCSLWK